MRIPSLPLVAAAALIFPGAAAAGEAPRAELFGGYSYMRDTGESFHGWNASLAWNLGGVLGVVADLAGHYGSAADGGDLETLSFLAGPRLCWRRESVTPFVHALVGGVRRSAGLSVFGVSISASDTNLGGAVGGGLDFRLNARWGLRVQGDYVLVRAEGESGGKETSGNPRVSVGAVMRWGSR